MIEKVCQGCPDRFEGCVKLAEDQSLPEYPASLRISLYAEDVQQDMLKKNFWRIQELEG